MRDKGCLTLQEESSGVGRTGGLRLALVSCMLVGGVLAASNLVGQQMPLAPLQGEDELLAPFFEGWYENPDGTYTLTFGYFNRSRLTHRHIPVGERNRLEPAEYDGRQVTVFPPGREMGVFAVTVPSTFTTEDIVRWTLTYETSRGPVTHTVPGRIGSDAYVLDYQPMPAGSEPPLLWLHGVEAPPLQHPMGVMGGYLASAAAEAPVGTLGNPERLTASVGEPLSLSVSVEDQIAMELRDVVTLGVTWFTHQGPTAASFEPETSRVAGEGGEAGTSVNFSEPGEYLLRVRVDNWSAADSSSGNQCCWTNGYFAVTVAP